MKTLSKKAFDLIQRASESQNVLKTYGKNLAVQLSNRFSQEEIVLASDDVLKSFQAFKALLGLQAERLRSADQTVFKENLDFQESLHHREALTHSAYRFLVQMKMNLESLYGSEGLKQFGLDGETPQGPGPLSQLLGATMDALKSKGTLPEPLDPNLPVWSLEALIHQFEKIYRPFQESIDQVELKARETQQAQIQRREAMATLQKTLIMVNGVLVHYARFIDAKDLANHIRPAGGRSKKHSKNPAPEDSMP